MFSESSVRKYHALNVLIENRFGTMHNAMQIIPDKKRNAPRRTVQLSGSSQVIGQFSLLQCKGMPGSAALHISCNQASKCVEENCY